jgi:multiple sugar transport system permease protein
MKIIRVHRGTLDKTLSSALLFIFVLFFLFPVIWLFLQSLTIGLTSTILTSPGLAILYRLSIGNYESILSPGSTFFLYAQNSALMASTTTVLTLLLGSLAAYALAKLRMKRAQDLKIWLLSLRFLPPIAIVVPLFLVYVQLSLIDTQLGLILVYIMMNLPFTVWLMIASFEEIPVQVEEAALIDGCSRLQILRKIDIPLVRSTIAVVALFVFIACWNEFLFALVFAQMRAMTLPTGLLAHITQAGPEWGEMSAMAILMMLPVIAVAFMLQKHIVKSLTFGAVKG